VQPKQKKEAAALAALVGILAAYWGYALLSPRHEPPAPAARQNPVVAGKATSKTQYQAPPKVDLDLLSRAREPYNALKNMFAAVYTKPKLPPKTITVKPGVKAGEQPPLQPLKPAPPPRSQAEIAADNAREELNKIRVLGLLKRKDRTDVFLSLSGSTYIAGKGDNITKAYYLTDLGKDYIVVRDKDTGVEFRLNFDMQSKASKTMPSPGAAEGSGKGRPMPPGGPSGPGRPGPQGGGGMPMMPGGGMPPQVQGQPVTGGGPVIVMPSTQTTTPSTSTTTPSTSTTTGGGGVTVTTPSGLVNRSM